MGGGYPYLRERWPVAVLLLAIVVVPTVCVLWFMLRAMDNERLAVREELLKTYRVRAEEAADTVREYWRARLDRLAALEEELATEDAGAHFAALVASGDCDGVVVLGQGGSVAYPKPPPVSGPPMAAAWRRASALEYQQRDLKAAEAAYASMAADLETAAPLRGRAILARVRCLEKLGRRQEAYAVLVEGLAWLGLHPDLVDEQGWLLMPTMLVRAMELAPPDSAEHDGHRRELMARALDYGRPLMPGNQRLFLLRALENEMEAPEVQRLRVAETISQAYANRYDERLPESRLSPTPVAEVWGLRGPAGSSIYLFREAALLEDLAGAAADRFRDWPLTATPVFRQERLEEGEPVARLPLGESLAEIELAVMLSNDAPFEAASRERLAVYLWTGVLTVASVVLLAALVGHFWLRQLRVASLKNELTATVSHELKTPLASMRVLVDTLLEERCTDTAQRREYLELIARENLRLSRLIDNFLTFSRMERNKHAFVFEPINLAEVVDEAVAATAERFSGDGCSLRVDVPESLPTVLGDRDALITVLLNLLDNAYKYTGDKKEVEISASATEAHVSISVSDNGEGMRRRVARRAFQRFYQADQQLSRRAGGCGLGLSIVQFVVKAHNGRIDVESAPGQGSRFTVFLPTSGNGG